MSASFGSNSNGAFLLSNGVLLPLSSSILILILSIVGHSKSAGIRSTISNLSMLAVPSFVIAMTTSILVLALAGTVGGLISLIIEVSTTLNFWSCCAILPLIISILVLMVWFFCACYGWLVLVFPTFKLFPMWAFVLLMFIMSIGNQFWKLFFSDRYE